MPDLANICRHAPDAGHDDVGGLADLCEAD